MSSAPLLLHVFSTFAPGGPQVRTTRLMGALGDRYRHSVLALDGCTDAREILPEGAPVEILDSFPRTGTLGTIRAMRRLYRELSPDAVLTYNWGAIEAVLAARFAPRRRVLHHEDGFRPDEVAGFKKRRVLFRRAVLSGVDLIVPSHVLADIATGLWKLPAARVHLIPNGIETDDFPPRDGNAELRAELGIPHDAVVIGFVGHLRPEKNAPRLVRAFAALGRRDDAHLVLLGDGPQRGAIEAAAAECDVAGRTHVVGHKGELAPWYRLFDVFAISSDTEQMPVALLEAMSASLPVASTDVGDVRRMLPEEQAELIVSREGDQETIVERLAVAIDTLASDAGRRADLGRCNRERATCEYSLENMVRAYQQRISCMTTTDSGSPK